MDFRISSKSFVKIDVWSQILRDSFTQCSRWILGKSKNYTYNIILFDFYSL